jgi:hypothetical protein
MNYNFSQCIATLFFFVPTRHRGAQKVLNGGSKNLILHLRSKLVMVPSFWGG